MTSVALLTSSKFLSTPSARRATPHIEHRGVREAISIHALREEGDDRRSWAFSIPTRISIHALREEGDYECFKRRIKPNVFLSTPSARRATAGLGFQQLLRDISIHALREEGDPRRLRRCLLPCHFYPRPPRGGRHQIPLEQWYQTNFYPRPPRGGRRAVHRSDHGQQPISIHALREEGDEAAPRMDEAMAPFLSTPSARRATAGKQEDGVVTHISIPALREEGDGKPHRGDHGHSGISIPALREEGDRAVL